MYRSRVGFVCRLASRAGLALCLTTTWLTTTAVWGQAVSRPVSPFPVVVDRTDLAELLGGVPSGTLSDETLELTLTDAVARGVAQNLAILREAETVRQAQGERRRTLARLLPHLDLAAGQARRQVNLDGTGFSRLPGFPTTIGPFDAFDARLEIELSLLDLSALADLEAGSARLRAEEHAYRSLREVVVLAVSSLYLRAQANRSLVEAIAAEVRTSEALLELARSRNRSGLAPGIEVLRAEVREQADRQRQIAAETRHQESRLRLARAIGLPLGQPFELADSMHYVPLAPISLDRALERAFVDREDYRSQEERVAAAAAERRAATRQRWPSLELHGDYGRAGFDPAATGARFNLTANLRIPLYQGGEVEAEVLEADAELRRAEVELADLRSAIYYQVRTALLEVEAADAQVGVARRRLELAEQQLRQARNRFAAGVSSNLEVVEGQEGLARANEGLISSLLAHSIAKGTLARAVGAAESALIDAVRGQELEGEE